MSWAVVFNFLGRCFILFSGLFLFPLAVSIYEAIIEHPNISKPVFWKITPEILTFFFCFVFLLTLGYLLKKRFSVEEPYINIRSALISVVLTWVILIFISAVPFVCGKGRLGLVNALFETTSGYTTTGATVIADVESLPKSKIFWRSFTQWIGGIGIIVISASIFPLIGVSGFRIFKAEAQTLFAERITPRVGQTARLFIIIYFFLTAVETFLLKISGMTFFDALCHSFTTLATGGFSTKNNGIIFFKNSTIEIIIMVFMFLAAINYILYLKMFTSNFKEVFTNSEFKAYVCIAILFVFIIFISNAFYDSIYSREIGLNIKDSFFQTLSALTTTGFANADFNGWYDVSRNFLLILIIIGGCTCSSAGSIKIARWVIIFKVIAKEFKQLCAPRGIFILRLGKKIIEPETVESVAAFIFLYFITLGVGTFLVQITSGLDFVSSFSATISCQCSFGPAFNKLGPLENYSFIPDITKIIFSVIMFIGRLELFTILVIFSRRFWKK